jgi:hypothetical protein
MAGRPAYYHPYGKALWNRYMYPGSQMWVDRVTMALIRAAIPIDKVIRWGIPNLRIGAQTQTIRIAVVPKADLVDNTDTFTISDGVTEVDFYYDVDGGGGGTGVAIDVSGDTTKEDVAVTTATAILGAGLDELLVMHNAPSEYIYLTLREPPNNTSQQYSVGFYEAVADVDFTILESLAPLPRRIWMGGAYGPIGLIPIPEKLPPAPIA